MAITDASAERMLDTGSEAATTRSLPDLLRHLENVEDRAGLLQMLAPRNDQKRWLGTAVSCGHASGARRSLSLAATRHTGQAGAVMVITDISETHPPAPPSITETLLRAIPARPRHGIALMDLSTGLVHEWIRPGPPPTDRWQWEIPCIHPDDISALTRTRVRLIDGLDQATNRWRIRFDSQHPWTHIHATWTVLTRTPTPQAMLDVHIDTAEAADRRMPMS